MVMCFRDRTYCSSKTCKNACGCKPPEDLAEQVERWWGGPDGPVCFSDLCDEEGNVRAHGLAPRAEDMERVLSKEKHEGT